MFCKFCGNQLPDGANFCPKCGKINDDVENASTGDFGSESAKESATFFTDATSDYVPVQLFDNEEEFERDERGGDILKMAILGLAFGASGLLSFLGIIFSAIARGKVSAYLAKYGETRGRATVGNTLSKVGLGVSIGYTVFFFFYFIFCFIIGFMSAI